MGLLGISLIVASVVLFCLRPPAWLPRFLGGTPPPRLPAPPSRRPDSGTEKDEGGGPGEVEAAAGTNKGGAALTPQPPTAADLARIAMPPPPTIPRLDTSENATSDNDTETTPKASAADRNDSIPTLSLSDATDDPPRRVAGPSPTATPRSAPGLMGPPPPRPPTLAPVPAKSLSVPTSRSSPLPNRAPGTSTLPLPRPSSSSLAPPPTHSAKPAKPSRAVVLTPGHSPLDWARLSSGPGADLRGLGPSASYLRVTPSMLRSRNGRRGRDAWTSFGGRVYNVTPYLPFHPGGEGELLRGAGKDGTRLFGEVHPWVNYEGMLAACLVGVMVSEEEAAVPGGGKMEEMD